MNAYLTAAIDETPRPFELSFFQSECAEDSDPGAWSFVSPANMRLAYVLLVHKDPQQAIRLIEALSVRITYTGERGDHLV